jgi:hypothetical protein
MGLRGMHSVLVKPSDYLEDPGVDGRILIRIFRKWDGWGVE